MNAYLVAGFLHEMEKLAGALPVLQRAPLKMTTRIAKKVNKVTAKAPAAAAGGAADSFGAGHLAAAAAAGGAGGMLLSPRS